MARPDVLMVGAYPEADTAEMAAAYRLHKLWLAPDRDAFLAEHGPAIRAVATRGELGADAALMSALPHLEMVACYGVGVDAIDRAHARSRGIAVTNTPDVLTEDVADLGVALLLAAARCIPAGDAHVRAGRWPAGNMALTTRVWGKRVGIVGMGRIGQAVARRLAAFGCDIAYSGRTRRNELAYRFEPDLKALAASVDMLVLTLTGGEATRGIIDASVLSALGPDGILVNIARGSVIDEPALLAALETGGIRAAGLDVFWNEPRIDPRFLALDNVVLQPHHASGTVETRRAMGQLVRDNLAAHFAGRPLITPVV